MTAPAVFGYPVASDGLWEERSVYTFALLDPTESDTGSPAPPPIGMLGLQSQGAAAPGSGFRANVVVIRERSKDRSLEEYATEQRAKLDRKLPTAVRTFEGDTTVGALAARRVGFRVVLDHPLPSLMQYHVSVLRDGYAYHFCFTDKQKTYEDHVPAFHAFLASWGGA